MGSNPTSGNVRGKSGRTLEYFNESQKRYSKDQLLIFEEEPNPRKVRSLFFEDVRVGAGSNEPDSLGVAIRGSFGGRDRLDTVDENPVAFDVAVAAVCPISGKGMIPPERGEMAFVDEIVSHCP